MFLKTPFLQEPDDGSVPDWHIELIEKRLADYRKNSMKRIPWEEFEKELFDLLDEDKSSFTRKRKITLSNSGVDPYAEGVG